MTPRESVALAKAIAEQYPFSIHGLDFAITNDPTYPESVILIIAESDFNMFSEKSRLILTEEVIGLLKLIESAGIYARIEKIGEWK